MQRDAQPKGKSIIRTYKTNPNCIDSRKKCLKLPKHTEHHVFLPNVALASQSAKDDKERNVNNKSDHKQSHQDQKSNSVCVETDPNELNKANAKLDKTKRQFEPNSRQFENY